MSLAISEKYKLELRHGDHVSVDEKAINDFSEWILKRGVAKAAPQQWRDIELYPEDSCGREDISQFFTLGNSINFRYWWFDPDGKLHYCEGNKGGKHYRGATYMWRSLMMSYEVDRSFLEANKLAGISVDEVRAIFRDDNGMDVMPALEERAQNWRDLGAKLRDFWGGRFFTLVEEANQSLFLFVQYSRQFRAFDDPLCKMIMVNAIMHQGRGLVSFDEKPFPGIDYELLKQVMRNGILELDAVLEAKVSNGQMLSFEESSELRRAGLFAFIKIMEATGVSGDILDNLYWFNRVACKTDTPVCKIQGKEKDCFFYGICPEKVGLKILYELTRYY